jgi:FlaA1/EpsC-like NDP-sugar epimerase
MAEIYVQALHAAHAGPTRFMAVRFGNVMGSSGSVIPVFHRQIADGGPVKVTHPAMTRYFMTIPEASLLVLQSAAQGTGGEIFILDMGRPVKIVDLARQMIELSGLKPDTDIQIEFTGVRPGEKLFEEVTRQGENFAATAHPKIFRFLSPPEELARVRQTLQRLRDNLHRLDGEALKLMLQAVLPDYQPNPTPATREVLSRTKPADPHRQSGAGLGTGKRNLCAAPVFTFKKI